MRTKGVCGVCLGRSCVVFIFHIFVNCVQKLLCCKCIFLSLPCYCLSWVFLYKEDDHFLGFLLLSELKVNDGTTKLCFLCLMLV